MRRLKASDWMGRFQAFLSCADKLSRILSLGAKDEIEIRWDVSARFFCFTASKREKPIAPFRTVVKSQLEIKIILIKSHYAESFGARGSGFGGAHRDSTQARIISKGSFGSMGAARASQLKLCAPHSHLHRHCRQRHDRVYEREKALYLSRDFISILASSSFRLRGVRRRGN